MAWLIVILFARHLLLALKEPGAARQSVASRFWKSYFALSLSESNKRGSLFRQLEYQILDTNESHQFYTELQIKLSTPGHQLNG